MTQITQVCIGRFHHFHLARQLQRNSILKEIWTGYPRFKLKDELGIPPEKIKTFPWMQTPFMASGRLLKKSDWLTQEWAWWARQTLDWHVANKIVENTTLIALSGTGLVSGGVAKSRGGRHICDRGSSHIYYQNEIIKEEYKRWGLVYHGIDPRKIEKEEREYAQSDAITVPSEFVYRTFLERGVPQNKISKIPYGARLDRFNKCADPDPDQFVILWVGHVSLRKGFLYLLKAFQRLQHPKKKLRVIGSVQEEMKELLAKENLDSVEFMGLVPNKNLPTYYSRASVFVLSSLEEGLAMVMGEALACGCPVIATTNTGAEDLFSNGKEGFIIPIRSDDEILTKLEMLAQDETLRLKLGEAAEKKVRNIGGWDTYGDSVTKLCERLQSSAQPTHK